MTAESVPTTLLFADCAAVFQGGGCRAAAYGGAYAAAKERGTHFAEVAGASAGAIVAALIAAGAEPDWLDARLAELDFSGMLSRASSVGAIAGIAPGKLRGFLSLATGVGIYSTRGVGDWVEQQLRELLPAASRPAVQFKDLAIPLSVLAADLATGGPRVWSQQTSPSDSVTKAVRASCALPFFFEPEEGALVDGGVLSNLPVHLLRRPESDRLPILAFSLVDEGTRATPSNVQELGLALADTVVRGAQQLQLQLTPAVQVIEINTGDIKATDFKSMSAEKVASLRQAGYSAVHDFFDREGVAAHPKPAVSRVMSEAERYDVLAREFSDAQDQVVVATHDTEWVYDLFTALLLARLRRVRVTVILPSYNGPDEHRLYQRRILELLGCQTLLTPADQDLPVESFLFDPQRDRKCAVVLSGSGIVDASILRSREGDEPLLRLLHRALEGVGKISAHADPGGLGVTSASDEEVIATLSKVDQYRSADVEIAKVPLAAIDSWARYAHTFKHQQQSEAARVLRQNGLEPFGAYWVNLGEAGVRSLALPPVVERGNDGRCVVVNGVSRLLMLLREGHTEAICAVVSNVAAAPPATQVRKLSQVSVIIGRRKEPLHRYPGFQTAGVRKVEAVAHTLASLRPSPNGGD